MIGRKARMGMIFVGALALCALGAASAPAATTGTTAVTCVDTSPTINGDYTDEHCDTTGTLGASRYKHETIAQDTATSAVGTNAKTKNNTTESTTAILLATIGGVNVEISCTTVSATGTLKNSLVAEDHRITGSGIIVTFTGCVVTIPAGCTVNSPGQATGTLVTNTIKAESVEGTPMTQKYAPEVGTEFVKFEIKGCALAGTYSVTGTVSGAPSSQMAAGGGRGASAGATLSISLPKNASSTLIIAGQKAGLTLSGTVSMSGVGGKPIASTGPPFF